MSDINFNTFQCFRKNSILELQLLPSCSQTFFAWIQPLSWKQDGLHCLNSKLNAYSVFYFHAKIFCGESGYRSRCLSNANRALCHLSWFPYRNWMILFFQQLKLTNINNMCLNLQKWRIRVSIPVPLECESSALPLELIPQRQFYVQIDINIWVIKVSRVTSRIYSSGNMNNTADYTHYSYRQYVDFSQGTL